MCHSPIEGGSTPGRKISVNYLEHGLDAGWAPQECSTVGARRAELLNVESGLCVVVVRKRSPIRWANPVATAFGSDLFESGTRLIVQAPAQFIHCDVHCFEPLTISRGESKRTRGSLDLPSLACWKMLSPFPCI